MTAARAPGIRLSAASGRSPKNRQTTPDAELPAELVEVARTLPPDLQPGLKELLSDRSMFPIWVTVRDAGLEHFKKLGKDDASGYRAKLLGFFESLLMILLQRNSLPTENKRFIQRRRERSVRALRAAIKKIERDEAAAGLDARLLMQLSEIPASQLKSIPRAGIKKLELDERAAGFDAGWLSQLYNIEASQLKFIPPWPMLKFLSHFANVIERCVLGVDDPLLVALQAPQVGRSGRKRIYLERALAQCFKAYLGSERDDLAHKILVTVFPPESRELADYAQIGNRRRQARHQKKLR